MATATVSNDSKLTHDNYTATTTPQARTMPLRCSVILIQNMDNTNSVLFSFDGGVNYKTLIAGNAISMDVYIQTNTTSTYLIKSSAGTAAVECLYGSEA